MNEGNKNLFIDFPSGIPTAERGLLPPHTDSQIYDQADSKLNHSGNQKHINSIHSSRVGVSKDVVLEPDL